MKIKINGKEKEFYPDAAAHEIWDKISPENKEQFDKEKLFKDAFAAGAYYVKGCIECEEKKIP